MCEPCILWYFFLSLFSRRTDLLRFLGLSICFRLSFLGLFENLSFPRLFQLVQLVSCHFLCLRRPSSSSFLLASPFCPVYRASNFLWLLWWFFLRLPSSCRCYFMWWTGLYCWFCCCFGCTIHLFLCLGSLRFGCCFMILFHCPSMETAKFFRPCSDPCWHVWPVIIPSSPFLWIFLFYGLMAHFVCNSNHFGSHLILCRNFFQAVDHMI